MKCHRQILFLACCVLTAASPICGKDRWLFGETEHFEIASSASAKRTHYIVEELDLIRAVFEQLNSGMLALSGGRLQVVICRNDDTMKLMVPLYKGNPKELGGLFSSDYKGPFILINSRGARDHSKSIVYHEYVHFLTDSLQMHLPKWLSEGIAEVFSTIEVSAGDRITIGRPPEDSRRILKRHSLMPLERLFSVGLDSPEYHSDKHGRGLFYAQSWALTHFLLFGDTDLPPRAYQRLVNLARQGVPVSEDAFIGVCGMPFDEMEQRLNRYIRNGAFKVSELDRLSLERSDKPILRPGRPGEENLVIGRVRLSTRGPSEAAGYLLHAYRNLPDCAEAAAFIGYLDYHHENFGEAEKYFNQALARGASSPASYLYAALSNMRTLNPDGNLSWRYLDVQSTMQLLDLLSSARELGESRPILYQTIGRVWLNSLLNPSKVSLRILSEGADCYPEDPQIGYFLARLLSRIGREDEAQLLLDYYASLDLDWDTRQLLQTILEDQDNS